MSYCKFFFEFDVIRVSFDEHVQLQILTAHGGASPISLFFCVCVF